MLHTVGQLIPAGLDDTVPDPLPDKVTTSEYGPTVKVAVTLVAVVMETVHVPVPEHAPPQPANVEPLEGVAVSVTDVPWSNVALQAEPQLIPAGLDVTVPVPDPASVTASTWPDSAKLTATDWAAVMETVQVLPVPEQPPPDQEATYDPVAGVAVSVTVMPYT
jgi:hypothetical protein